MAEERLQKILARAGVASRRKAEALITAGRVRVDGRVVSELGAKANPRRSTVELDGRRLMPEPLCYGIFHKPRGMVTTLSDPEGRPTAYDVLKQVGVRVVPVGRLDFNTSGALLFSNDGDFAQALQHARGKAPKVYAAKVTRPVDDDKLERWAQSIEIEGKKTRPAAVRVLRREGQKCWLEITIHEGRNRQVRRLGDHAGTPVDRLSRLSYAGVSTEGLRPGEWRLLTTDELKELKNQFGVPEKIRGSQDVTRSSGGSVPKTKAKPRPLRGSRAAEPKESAGPVTRSAASENSASRKSAAKSAASRSGGSKGAASRKSAAKSAVSRSGGSKGAASRNPASKGKSAATRTPASRSPASRNPASKGKSAATRTAASRSPAAKSARRSQKR